MIGDSLLTSHSPMQDVAPSAVRIADAIDAINCTINLVVSFLLIFTSFLFYPFTFLLFYLLPFYLLPFLLFYLFTFYPFTFLLLIKYWGQPLGRTAPKLKSIAGLIVLRI